MTTAQKIDAFEAALKEAAEKIEKRFSRATAKAVRKAFKDNSE
jgi:hypothetical protein